MKRDENNYESFYRFLFEIRAIVNAFSMRMKMFSFQSTFIGLVYPNMYSYMLLTRREKTTLLISYIAFTVQKFTLNDIVVLC